MSSRVIDSFREQMDDLACILLGYVLNWISTHGGTMSHSRTLSNISVVASLITITSVLSTAYAQTQPATAEPVTAVVTPGPFSANLSLTNDYRYRGISQSNFRPAIQGGFDYAHSSGFYIGNWNSSISWISDAASAAGNSASAPIEMDFTADTNTSGLKVLPPMSVSCSTTIPPRICLHLRPTQIQLNSMLRRTLHLILSQDI